MTTEQAYANQIAKMLIEQNRLHGVLEARNKDIETLELRLELLGERNAMLEVANDMRLGRSE